MQPSHTIDIALSLTHNALDEPVVRRSGNRVSFWSLEQAMHHTDLQRKMEDDEYGMWLYNQICWFKARKGESPKPLEHVREDGWWRIACLQRVYLKMQRAFHEDAKNHLIPWYHTVPRPTGNPRADFQNRQY